MLKRTKNLCGFRIHTTDGEIGHVEEMYFDDEKWTVRYIVIETGPWMLGKEVLISPVSVDTINWEQKYISVRLSKGQVKDSPDIDTDRPISRQKEMEYHRYYNIPVYWRGVGLWGSGMYPVVNPEVIEDVEQQQREHPLPENESGDTHLRSTSEVIGYYVHAVDGEIGHVEDFIFDDEKFAIRYMLIDTGKIFSGKKVLLTPKLIDKVVWEKSMVNVNTSKDKITSAPEFESDEDITQEYEERTFKHYNVHEYWKEDGEM